MNWKSKLTETKIGDEIKVLDTLEDCDETANITIGKNYKIISVEHEDKDERLITIYDDCGEKQNLLRNEYELV